MDAKVAKIPDMTVEGFSSYLAKFDQKARIVFRKVGAADYEKAQEAMAFTERLVPEGTMLVVGLE